MAVKTKKGKKNGNRSHPIELRPSIDQHVMRGRYGFMLGDLNGNPIWNAPLYTDNTVVTSGRAWVLKHIMSTQSANVSSQIISALAVGSSGTAPTTSDTLLGGEIVRVAITTETDNTSSSAPHVIWVASFNSTQGNDTTNGIREFGVFNTSASNASTMLARASTSSFTKTTSNTLKNWANSIVRWMFEFLLIDSNAAIANEAELATC